MEQLLKDFEEQLRFYNDGDLSSDEFFIWFCNEIEKYGGKLPPKNNDTETKDHK